MTQETMKPPPKKLTMRRQVRHGVSEHRHPDYTDDQLAEINARYDRENGFSLQIPTVHTNPGRKPETEFKP